MSSKRHIPEDLLESLVLGDSDLPPDLHSWVTAHVKRCSLCRRVLRRLLDFHREVETEVVQCPRAAALIQDLFQDTD